MKSLFIPFVCLIASVHCLPCDTGTTQIDDNFCLVMPTEEEARPMAFAEARQFCEDVGGILVSNIRETEEVLQVCILELRAAFSLST